jgi:hypothetical protein
MPSWTCGVIDGLPRLHRERSRRSGGGACRRVLERLMRGPLDGRPLSEAGHYWQPIYRGLADRALHVMERKRLLRS